MVGEEVAARAESVPMVAATAGKVMVRIPKLKALPTEVEEEVVVATAAPMLWEGTVVQALLYLNIL